MTRLFKVDKTRLNVNIPTKLKEWFVKHCIKQERDQSEVIRDLLEKLKAESK